VLAPRSRFIPEAMLELFEHRIVGFDRSTTGDGPIRPELPKVDLGAALLDMWR
jgi:hypothetical protein